MVWEGDFHGLPTAPSVKVSLNWFYVLTETHNRGTRLGIRIVPC